MSEKKHDHQFSIPFKGYRLFIDSFGSGDYLIDIGGKEIRFEWSDMFGPLPLKKDGSERCLSWSHSFWRAASLWNLQGKRLEGRKAIWHEPKKPVLKHMGGRNYLVIEQGEPGHDW